jgi:Cys-rich protein (TIGR01571 family)
MPQKNLPETAFTIPTKKIERKHALKKPLVEESPKAVDDITLFGCMEDTNVCCRTTWCPCWQWGRNREMAGHGSCWKCGMIFALCSGVCGFGALMSWYREKTIALVGAKPRGCCKGCCIDYFCAPCAICQEARQLKFFRKADLSD